MPGRFGRIDDPPLRSFAWAYMIACPTSGVLAAFNLMGPSRLADHPECRQLVAPMEREIRALRLGEMFDAG